ncbi:penicillin-insensitive murein endopeptidase precursor [mine drainage metagenome]|uniref:Penicillin-insensitive murein endopeptidase n=1 Tax=mine drainage metagenome TaxID=410659 RepID=A0A1J5PT75_9ZZZZ
MKFRLAFLILAASAAAALARGPAPGPLHIIGGPNTGGCIAGAVSLPAEGQGFETIHPDRSAFWGAPQTIAHLELFAHEAAEAGLPTLLVEDISNPRGGPMPGGHVSHQIGLDADVGLDMRPRGVLTATERQSIELRSIVRPDGRDIDQAVWSPRVIELLRIAAALPEVDRILVNPAIKLALCRDVAGDRSWLHLIRPWYGHAAHMHIRFRCPAGQADCIQAPPPPAGDGCDSTLQWWFDQLNAPAAPPSKPRAPPPLPAACRAILAGD